MTWRRIGAAITVSAMATMLTIGFVVAARHHMFASFFPADVGGGFAFSVVGAFLLLRGSVRSLAVILCVQGVSASASALTDLLRDVSAAAGPLHGASLWMAWTGNTLWLPGVILLVPLVVLFPDGRLVSRRWRWVLVLQGLLLTIEVVLGLGARTSLVDNKPYEYAPNPTAFLGGLSPALLDVVAEAAFLGVFGVLAVSVGSLVVRRRRAVGVERAQLTSLLFGTTVSIVLVVGSSGQWLPTTWWVWALSLLAVAPIPLAIGVAVLRYRLYEIDRVVSRTVAYALVLALLVGVYVGVLAGLAALIPTDYGQVGVAAATLVVAALAVPLTRRVRRIVDRRFHRSRFDAEQVVAAFAARLRAEPDRGDVGADLLAVLQRTVQPSHAAVWSVKR